MMVITTDVMRVVMHVQRGSQAVMGERLINRDSFMADVRKWLGKLAWAATRAADLHLKDAGPVHFSVTISNMADFPSLLLNKLYPMSEHERKDAYESWQWSALQPLNWSKPDDGK